MYPCKKAHRSVNPVRADKVWGNFPVRELKESTLYKPAQLMLIKGAMLKHILVFIECPSFYGLSLNKT